MEYPEAKAFDPLGVLAEFQDSILAELDFAQEIRNMERVEANFEGAAFVRVPRSTRPCLPGGCSAWSSSTA